MPKNNYHKVQLSLLFRVTNSFTLSAVWDAKSPSLLERGVPSLWDDHTAKLCKSTTKQMVSWYSAALLFEFLRLLHTECYPCINKNIRKTFFKMLSSRRALLRAGNSQETLARWSVTFRQHAVTNPLGFMGLFKLDICRQCIIYNQKHE